MCGFTGFIAEATAAPSSESLQRAVTHLLPRGPDGSGIFKRDWIGLGHTRLAIIDPSQAAHQPMVDHSGRYVLVYNGEIYNYQELYSRYCIDIDDGTVNAASDTAVLLAMYKLMGKACLEHLNGMFAFAIADLEHRTLFMARDRFGEKPLYWRKCGKGLLFGSEIRSLVALRPELSWQVDVESLALFHLMGSIPPPRTIYEHVHALGPGHWLEADANGYVSQGAYWSLESCSQASPEQSASISYAEVCHETQSRLFQAAQSRMVSDVEVGLFLSGGFDSGALLGLLHALKRTPVRTICLDFEESRYSEFSAAQTTARAFESPLHRHIITGDDFLTGLEGFFHCMDQPTIGGYNTYFVCRAAKALGIKAWVSGVGGDELFGGYPSFSRLHGLKYLGAVLQNSRLTPLLDVLAPRLLRWPRLVRALHLIDRGDRSVRAYQACRNPLPWRTAVSMLSPAVKAKMHDILGTMDEHYSSTEHLQDDFQRASVLEASMYMSALLLRDMDNFSMTHSLELRAPYLDHRLFEYVLGLPQQWKRQGPGIKPLLADALPVPLAPQTKKQGKRGFTFPVRHWLADHMTSTFEAYVFQPRNAQFWDLNTVSSLWRAYREAGDGSEVLWSLYVFSRWMSRTT
ncbi:MAG TPA: asparagine synthase (glutamine-hydrolyzing) [Nitrospira sp.]|nr:asparagine synthase (glutamine-hydrolyzing) [Nitrospira sp.]